MKNEITVLNYLLRTWYDEKHWLLSVRRSAVKMALRRTTVFVEAYRSVLKLLNPQSYTSSCYLVIHIIDVRLCQNSKMTSTSWGMEQKYMLWRHYISSWEMRRNLVSNGNYVTHDNEFEFLCPFWLRSQFFLCKYVIGDQNFPQYTNVTIQHRQPFIVVLKRKQRECKHR